MIKKSFLSLIKLYQLILSPDQGFFSLYRKKTCRYFPTCSEYTYQAISKYGVLPGLFKGCKRIFRCHPWHTGGCDPLI